MLERGRIVPSVCTTSVPAAGSGNLDEHHNMNADEHLRKGHRKVHLGHAWSQRSRHTDVRHSPCIREWSKRALQHPLCRPSRPSLTVSASLQVRMVLQMPKQSGLEHVNQPLQIKTLDLFCSDWMAGFPLLSSFPHLHFPQGMRLHFRDDAAEALQGLGRQFEGVSHCRQETITALCFYSHPLCKAWVSLGHNFTSFPLHFLTAAGSRAGA